MEQQELENLRYPMGRFQPGPPLSREQRADAIDELARLPAQLRGAVQDLTEEQLDRPYRPGGWTVRQVVHHVPDSHLNAYLRFKLAATEDEPTIQTYDEAAWAELPEARHGSLEMSLRLLEALHWRWVTFLGGLESQDWSRAFRHPEWGQVTLDQSLQLYVWHGRHHLAHIERLREREG